MEFVSSLILLLILVVGTNEKSISDDAADHHGRVKRAGVSKATDNTLMQLKAAPISDKKAGTQKPSPNDGTSTNLSPPKESADTQKDTGGGSSRIPSYIRIVPAAIMVFIFLAGLGSIYVWQKVKDKRQQKRDIQAFDDETAHTWMEQLRTVQRRPTLVDKIKRTTQQDESEAEKEGKPEIVDRQKRDIDEKYMLYDSMLAKYRASLAHTVKQKRAAQGSQSSFGSGNASGKSLKDLAARHRALCNNSGKGEEIVMENGPESALVEWQKKRKMSLMKEKSNGEEQDPGITFGSKPSGSHRKHSSHRSRKESEKTDEAEPAENEAEADQETVEAECRIKTRRTSLQKQPKISLDDKTASALVVPTLTVEETGEDEHAPPAIIDDVQICIQPPSRPATPDIRTTPTPPITDEVIAQPSICMETDSEPLLPLLSDHDHELLNDIGATAPAKSKLRTTSTRRERPKSLFANLSNITNIKKPFKKRPRSLVVKSSIAEEDLELANIDFESLHKLQFKNKSEADIAKIFSSVERKMIADIYQSSKDLNTDEVKALELLLDDVSKFSGDDRRGSTRWLEARQYSLGSDRSVSPVHVSRERLMEMGYSPLQMGQMGYLEDGRTPSPRLLTTPLSFADSESLFTSLDEGDEDEEQMFLMGIKEDPRSAPGKVMSNSKGNGRGGGGTLSTYDNL